MQKYLQINNIVNIMPIVQKNYLHVIYITKVAIANLAEIIKIYDSIRAFYRG